jgi:hypothetical protein
MTYSRTRDDERIQTTYWWDRQKPRKLEGALQGLQMKRQFWSHESTTNRLEDKRYDIVARWVKEEWARYTWHGQIIRDPLHQSLFSGSPAELRSSKKGSCDFFLRPNCRRTSYPNLGHLTWARKDLLYMVMEFVYGKTSWIIYEPLPSTSKVYRVL